MQPSPPDTNGASQHQISIHIELSGIHGRMQRVLRKAMSVVAIGLNAKAHISADTLSIPDVTMHHQFDTANRWTVDEAKEAYQLWVLRNGFRDIAEGLQGLFEEIQSVLAYWDLALLQGTRPVRTEDWNEIVVHRADKFHRRTFSQKLEFLEKQYGFTLSPVLNRQALAVNAVRNCLTHRDGVVSAVDCDASGALTLDWSALVLLARKNGEEEEVAALPYMAQEGTEIAITTRPRSKAFGIGESVSLSAEEFTQVCWTLYQLAVTCAQTLEAYGKDHGFVFTSPPK